MAVAVGSPDCFDIPGRLGRSPSPPQRYQDDASGFDALRSRMVYWSKDRLHAARECDAQQGLRALAREKAEVADLKREVEAVRSLVEVAGDLCQDGERLSVAVQQSVQASSYRSAALVRAGDELREAHAERCGELQREEQQRRRRSGSRRREGSTDGRRISSSELSGGSGVEVLEQALGLYRRRLGLDISRLSPQTVQVKLLVASAPEAAPSRVCFSLCLGGSAEVGVAPKFRISDWSPLLPTAAALVDELNKDPSSPYALPAFFCAVRRAFQAFLAAECIAASF